jgi:Lrp/AsnC family leucine-responsive transcriptional regulator
MVVFFNARGVALVSDKKIELDATDWKILDALQNDARITFREIGSSVGLTAPAVRERILRMEDAGIITGYGINIDPAALGRTMHVIISFKFDSDRAYRLKPNAILTGLLSSCRDVVRYWETYGDLDFLIEAAFSSKQDLDGFLDTLREYGFARTHIIVMSTKEKYERPFEFA